MAASNFTAAVSGAAQRSESAANPVLVALWTAPFPLVLVDRELRLVQINSAAARMAGLAVEDAPGRPAEEVLGPLSRSPELRSVLDTGAPASAELRRGGRSGE